jgi:hypothetical protein
VSLVSFAFFMKVVRRLPPAAYIAPIFQVAVPPAAFRPNHNGFTRFMTIMLLVPLTALDVDGFLGLDGAERIVFDAAVQSFLHICQEFDTSASLLILLE